MTSRAAQQVTLVEILELTQPYAQVAPLLTRAVERLEREGVRGLVSMHFHTRAEQRELAAVITFASAAQMMEHAAMISGWDEFKQFATMVKLVDLRVHGVPSAEFEAWASQFGGPARKYPELVVGFTR